MAEKSTILRLVGDAEKMVPSTDFDRLVDGLADELPGVATTKRANRHWTTWPKHLQNDLFEKLGKFPDMSDHPSSQSTSNMEMAEHTPGPWSHDDPQPGCSIPILAGGECVADVWSHHFGFEEARANACLIDAAPEMLKMLQSLLKTPNVVMGLSEQADIGELITKATGGRF